MFFENLQILSFVLRDVVSLSRIVFLMLRLSSFLICVLRDVIRLNLSRDMLLDLIYLGLYA